MYKIVDLPAKPGTATGSEINLAIMDSNEAAAFVAYKTNEACIIDTTLPRNRMGNNVEEWAAEGVKNIFGKVPQIIKGDASPTPGTLYNTVSSSRGVFLKVPQLYAVAGQLTPTVIHAATKAGRYPSSIFGGHSDIMAARTTGFGTLFANNPQEVMDLALISQATTIASRVPFINVFDDEQTTRHSADVKVVPDHIMRAFLEKEEIDAYKKSVLASDVASLDTEETYFRNQGISNFHYMKVPAILKDKMEKFALLTGRKYGLYEYYGHAHPSRIIIIMGSATAIVKQTVDRLNAIGETVGLMNVRLFRPFSINDFIEAIPGSVTDIAVLDRCKLPNGIGEPLFMNIVNAFNEYEDHYCPTVISGRYGLTSRELTEPMVLAVFEEMKKKHPKKHFSIGIEENESCLSRWYDENKHDC